MADPDASIWGLLYTGKPVRLCPSCDDPVERCGSTSPIPVTVALPDVGGVGPSLSAEQIKAIIPPAEAALAALKADPTPAKLAALVAVVTKSGSANGKSA